MVKANGSAGRRAAQWERGGPAVVAAVIVAAHLAGQGWIMSRSGAEPVEPAGGLGLYDADMVAISVAVVILAGIGAAAAVEVWPAPAAGWRGVLPARPWWVATGALVALFLPLVWGVGRPGMVPGGFAAWMYALPWGTGLASVGWLRGRPAVVVAVTVIVSAIVCVVFTVSLHIPPAPVED